MKSDGMSGGARGGGSGMTVKAFGTVWVREICSAVDGSAIRLGTEIYEQDEWLPHSDALPALAEVAQCYPHAADSLDQMLGMQFLDESHRAFVLRLRDAFRGERPNDDDERAALTDGEGAGGG